MKAELKNRLAQTKEWWKRLTRNKKILLVAAVGTILTVAIVGTILLNAPEKGYKAIFPGMTSEEAVQVYATLQEMGVPTQMSDKQEIMVPNDKWDSLIFELNGKGYPKTALSYDTFQSATGFTSTEFEKRVALTQQAQDRMQQTLLRQDGIEDVTVTFNVPETSNYIWDQNNQQESSAGVNVKMKPGVALTPERVSAIKHLASTSVPKLKPESVVVIDAATGIEMQGVEENNGAHSFDTRMLELERDIAKTIEDNVRRLLSPRYGADGVTAVATVALDYDKMMTESKEYQARPNGDGGGIKNHYEENYTLGGNVPVQGIVGEENNTDIPQYPNADGTGEAQTTDYNRTIDYDNSYILTQIEKGQAIKRASVAVVVNDPDFDTQTEETLVDLVSKGVNISADNIKVTNLNLKAVEPPAQPAITPAQPASQRQILIALLCGGLLLILLIVLILVMLSRRRRRKVEAELEAIAEAERQSRLEVERNVAEHKRRLQSEALAAAKPEESAIAEDVRNFADDNPEIAASLIRAIMREGK